MDLATIISLCSLAIALLGMPVSYFVATKQVKVGFEEQERRAKRRTRLLIADRLERLTQVFFETAYTVGGINLKNPAYDRAKLVHHMGDIDEQIRRSGHVERVAKSIEDYNEAGVSDHERHSDIATRLAEIQELIHAGPSAQQPLVWAILDKCKGDELAARLREH